jgi:multiple sugar transport system ATP-binding protein
MSSMATIELRNVVKRYGSTIAVNNVNLIVDDSEFLVLLGPSGCGKTTTLRSIAGLETIDDGEILIDNVVVNEIRPSDRDTAFCFQQYALYPHLTAYENIAFPLRTQKLSKSEIDRRVIDVGDVLRLKDIFKYKPKKLSGGDQQRVALARAMVRQPKVYLMDEPLSNLDAKLRVDMRADLRRLQIDNGTTTVYVTHDQIEAMAMADRIAIMNNGVMLQVGSPDDVYSYPSNLFVANFIGSPSMNFINCSFEKDTRSVAIPTNGEVLRYILPDNITQNIDNLSDKKELILGIRPEDVKIHIEPLEIGFEIRMVLMEALGSENIHHLQRHNLEFKARTPPSDIYEENQPLWVSFEPEGIRLFDQKTEEAI